MEGEREITIGAGTWFGSGCWLNAIGGTITVEDGCSFAGDVTISAAAAVTLGRDVLVARGSGGVLGGVGGVGAAGGSVPDQDARFGLLQPPALGLLAAMVVSA